MQSAMSSRYEILKAVRKHAPTESPELPPVAGPWIVYPDRERQFTEVLQGVGGKCFAVSCLDEIKATLAELPQYASAKKICSTVPDLCESSIDLAQVTSPHLLEDVDVAIVAGEFGVAENGAVWVTDEQLRHRVILFLAQHLVLVVPRDQILDNMHQAYERLHFDKAGFGVFISGPSKTADIEQSLVIGAHGARSLTVFLLS